MIDNLGITNLGNEQIFDLVSQLVIQHDSVSNYKSVKIIILRLWYLVANPSPGPSFVLNVRIGGNVSGNFLPLQGRLWAGNAISRNHPEDTQRLANPLNPLISKPGHRRQNFFKDAVLSIVAHRPIVTSSFGSQLIYVVYSFTDSDIGYLLSQPIARCAKINL
ncbi:MAG: hypothetical protein GY789_20640 [Hyphomicrobiales bacterium]|nr:hypothetical protein [Hyphomicrobiales bacterium]